VVGIVKWAQAIQGYAGGKTCCLEVQIAQIVETSSSQVVVVIVAVRNTTTKRKAAVFGVQAPALVFLLSGASRGEIRSPSGLGSPWLGERQ
jgi:hypothetical protein